VNLVGHREVPADVFFDEPQSRARVHIGFAPPRLWITSGLPTILELASPITTCSFVGTNQAEFNQLRCYPYPAECILRFSAFC
jgi:hypothetical protein